MSNFFPQAFIKRLELADPPIIPPDYLTTFLQTTMSGYTEVLLGHQLLLIKLFKMQSSTETPDPEIAVQYVIECLTQLHDVYADYFSDIVDRRYVLRKEKRRNESFSVFVEVCD